MVQPTSGESTNMVKCFAVCTTFLFIKYFNSIMLAVDPTKRPEEDKNLITNIKIPDEDSFKVITFW